MVGKDSRVKWGVMVPWIIEMEEMRERGEGRGEKGREKRGPHLDLVVGRGGEGEREGTLPNPTVGREESEGEA